jgi:intracellular sulfur oxidation DsrE/DsrF family protein
VHAARDPQPSRLCDHFVGGNCNNVENLRKALGADTKVEVVVHGSGLGLLLATNTAQSGRMKQLAGDGLVFAACRNTMQRQNVSADQLLPFATTVDSGVAEVVRKQWRSDRVMFFLSPSVRADEKHGPREWD